MMFLKIFSCDTFEEDQERLFQSLRNTEKAKEHTGLFYPGPFRLLILKDGRVVKRGLVSMVPESDAGQLIKRDGLFKIENFRSTEPQFFQELYMSYGARCLIGKYISYEQPVEERIQDLTSLDRTSPELKEQLLKIIKNNKKYFILTGSDSRDKLGCCPSELVTGANRLMSAGILDSYRDPAPGETCPVSIYAFKNEMKITGNDLQFNIDNDFRQVILKKLEKKMNSGFRDFNKMDTSGIYINNSYSCASEIL